MTNNYPNVKETRAKDGVIITLYPEIRAVMSYDNALVLHFKLKEFFGEGLPISDRIAKLEERVRILEAPLLPARKPVSGIK
jgi:hypothetical protein